MISKINYIFVKIVVKNMFKLKNFTTMGEKRKKLILLFLKKYYIRNIFYIILN